MSRGLRTLLTLTRRSPASLRVLLALFYLTLGISGAWHAPHFSRGAAAIGNDRHEHHETVNSESCALCTVKNAPHQVADPIIPFVGSGFASIEAAAVAPCVQAAFAAFLARGPPAPLS